MANDELLRHLAETNDYVNESLFPEWVIDDMYVKDRSIYYAVVHLKYPRFYGLIVTDEYNELGGVSLELTREFRLTNIHWIDMPKDVDEVSPLCNKLRDAITEFEESYED